MKKYVAYESCGCVARETLAGTLESDAALEAWHAENEGRRVDYLDVRDATKKPSKWCPKHYALWPIPDPVAEVS